MSDGGGSRRCRSEGGHTVSAEPEMGRGAEPDRIGVPSSSTATDCFVGHTLDTSLRSSLKNPATSARMSQLPIR